MALIAVDENPVSGTGSRPRAVGVCRYVRLPDERACEFAIVVADDWQGRGLGRRMMQRLIDIARSRGLAEMIGWVLAENAGMLHMMSTLGFAIAADPDDAHNRKVVLTLAEG
jgi:acetyltransferase